MSRDCLEQDPNGTFACRGFQYAKDGIVEVSDVCTCCHIERMGSTRVEPFVVFFCTC